MLYLFLPLFILAAAFLLLYFFGYAYLFSGISKTYLRGRSSAHIDDGKLFRSHSIEKGNPKPWTLDEQYNKVPLPKHVLQDLEDSHTASFLVIKNGKIIQEKYFNGYQASSKTNSFSMAKAVTVMLLGKAIEEGKIKSLDQKFSDFFPEFLHKPLAENLTLRHLAAMEAGLDWEENYKNPLLPNAKAYYGASLKKAVFSRKFQQSPGENFEYQSGATQLLGFAVQKAVGQSLASYLSDHFWKPLGMEENAEWSVDQSGMEKTYCCIHANTRDFAKLGQLFLDGGKSSGKTLLSEDFVQKMQTGTALSGKIYGLGFWVNEDNPIQHYYFLGLQGQYIIMVPEKNMVIVRTGSYQNLPKQDRGRPNQVRFLVNEIAKLH